MIQKFRLFDFYNFKKWKKFTSLLLFFTLFILIYLVILGFVIVSFGNGKNTNFDNLDNSRSSQFDTKFDTIIVLGAGLIDNSVSPVLEARIDHALDLYQKNAAKSIIFTGGIGFDQKISEGEASFDWAIEKLEKEKKEKIEENSNNLNNNLNGLQNISNSKTLKPPNLETKYNLFFEKISKTTKQNLSEAQQIMKQNNLQTAIIVSDSLHLFRTSQIANLLQMKVQTSPTPYSVFKTLNSQSQFLFRELFFCQVFWLIGN